MAQLGTLGKLSHNLILKFKPYEVPLCRADCRYQKSKVNKLVNEWLYMRKYKERFLDEQSIDKSKLRAAAARAPLSPSPEPDIYRKCLQNINNKKDIKQDYLTTTKYKRISPEFLALLKNKRSQSLKNTCIATPRAQIKQLRRQGRATKKQDATTLQMNGKILDQTNPILAAYLHEVMEKNYFTNRIYGIDFYSEDPTDQEYYNTYMSVDPAEVMQILQYIQSHSLITQEELDMLRNFLISLALMGEEELQSFVDLLQKNGILTYDIVVFLDKLLASMAPAITTKDHSYISNTLYDALNRVRACPHTVLSGQLSSPSRKEQPSQVRFPQFQGSYLDLRTGISKDITIPLSTFNDQNLFAMARDTKTEHYLFSPRPPAEPVLPTDRPQEKNFKIGSYTPWLPREKKGTRASQESSMRQSTTKVNTGELAKVYSPTNTERKSRISLGSPIKVDTKPGRGDQINNKKVLRYVPFLEDNIVTFIPENPSILEVTPLPTEWMEDPVARRAAKNWRKLNSVYSLTYSKNKPLSRTKHKYY